MEKEGNSGKNAKFRSRAEKRVRKLIKDIRELGNLATKRYDYNGGEVEQIFTALYQELETTQAKFVPSKSREEVETFAFAD